MAGWEFHYDHWENPDGARFRSGATRHNPFPANRKGNLDYDLLKKMGLTKERLVSHDALFFWQLLFPICDPEKSGIADDPRIPYYSSVEKWSTLYAASLGILSGSYGHNVKPFSSLELLHFDMVVIRDGVLGGQRGAIYRRWKKDCSAYDTYTVDSTTSTLGFWKLSAATSFAIIPNRRRRVNLVMIQPTNMTTSTSV